MDAPSLEIFKHCLDAVLHPGEPALAGAGPGDLQGSLPNSTVLGFCEMQNPHLYMTQPNKVTFSDTEA